ncbi:MAG: hypothetical protein ACI9YE_002665 [Psychroserpens sp.]
MGINNEAIKMYSTFKLVSIFIFLLFTTNLGAQVSHDFGVSFSGQRIWEIDADDYINQDHDFSISPSLVYQLNLSDRRLLLRAELSWFSRFSDSENREEETGFIVYRNDINHLAALNLNFGVALYKNRNSSLQLLGGAMITRDYFSSTFFRVERPGDGESRISGVGLLPRPLKVDFTGSISYQFDLLKGSKYSAGSELDLIIAWDFVYITSRRSLKLYIDNDFPSFSTGPKLGIQYSLASTRRERF